MIFGSVTGRDPRSLGENECSAFELGISRAEAKSLQQVAFDQLAGTGAVTRGAARRRQRAARTLRRRSVAGSPCCIS